MPRGGKRPGAGRKKGSVSLKNAGKAILGPDTGRLFAQRVMRRLKENAAPDPIKSPEDFLLSLLYAQDIQTRSHNFNRLLDRVFGPPPKAITISGPASGGNPIPLNLSSDVFERLITVTSALRDRHSKPAPKP